MNCCKNFHRFFYFNGKEEPKRQIDNVKCLMKALDFNEPSYLTLKLKD